MTGAHVSALLIINLAKTYKDIFHSLGVISGVQLDGLFGGQTVITTA